MSVIEQLQKLIDRKAEIDKQMEALAAERTGIQTQLDKVEALLGQEEPGHLMPVVGMVLEATTRAGWDKPFGPAGGSYSKHIKGARDHAKPDGDTKIGRLRAWYKKQPVGEAFTIAQAASGSGLSVKEAGQLLAKDQPKFLRRNSSGVYQRKG